MPDAEDIDDIIAEAAAKPQSMTHGNRSISQRTLADLIKAREHLAAQESTQRPGGGIRFQQITPRY